MTHLFLKIDILTVEECLLDKLASVIAIFRSSKWSHFLYQLSCEIDNKA